MNIGNFLLELRKSKQLSQEEVAERLDVTRQTVSKWETDQTTPDFDKIRAICNLYEITPNELLSGKREENTHTDITGDSKFADVPQDNALNETKAIDNKARTKKAVGIILGIMLYFVAISWISIAIPCFLVNPLIASGIFLLILGVATCTVIFSCILFKDDKKTDVKSKSDKAEDERSLAEKLIIKAITLATLAVYLAVSILTMAWHITWILWVVYGLVRLIFNLVSLLKENENEK